MRGRTERASETRADIATQHGITEAALVRANPSLNHREPREGEWLLIPVH
ncbi:MAG: LysM domain-containing protein [Ilumatobacteraceae bacterium]